MVSQTSQYLKNPPSFVTPPTPLSPAGQDVPTSPIKMLFKNVNLQFLVWLFGRKGKCSVAVLFKDISSPLIQLVPRL